MKRLNSIDEDGEWQLQGDSSTSSRVDSYRSISSHTSFTNYSSMATSSTTPTLPSIPSSSTSFLSQHFHQLISSGYDEYHKNSSHILNCLVTEAILKSPSSHWKEKFLNIDWQNIENQNHEPFLSLSLVLAESLDFILTENDSQILLRNYSLKKNQKFHWKKFLFDFFTKLAAKEIEQEESHPSHRSDLNGENGSSDQGPGYQLWQHVQQKFSIIHAMSAFKASGAEKARHRALLLLLNAIGKLQNSRFGRRGEMNFAASINRSDFRKYNSSICLLILIHLSPLSVSGVVREVHRVFDVKLSQFESDALFEVFDDDGPFLSYPSPYLVVSSDGQAMASSQLKN
jgi:hypothetical protein